MPCGQPASVQREAPPLDDGGFEMPPVASCNLVAEQFLPTSVMQEETFRSVVDEVHLQHERLTTVYK